MANPNSPTTVRAVEAVLGGLILGTSSGIYMYVAGKVAGNSGAVKACVLSIADSPKNDASRTSNILFLVGLLTAGLVTSFATPWGFEPYAPIKDEWYSYVFGGLLVGSGTYLANGCTSGHGLSGLSKFSLRSVVATPIFMFFAALTAMIKSSFAVGPIAPFVASPVTRLHSVGWMLLVLLVLFVPVLVLKKQGPHYTKHVLLYVGLWCGLAFGVGLAVGGMVRPSAVTGALSMKRFDFTLWILFTTGLVTTFVHYRIAEWMGIKGARAQKQGPYDKKLIGGSILFGIGWGLTGVCPGPLILGAVADFNTLASTAITGGPLLMLCFVFIGTAVAQQVSKNMCPAVKPVANASVETMANAILNSNAIVLDVRSADEREVSHAAPFEGMYECYEGTLSTPLDRSDPANFTIPVKCLPSDTTVPLIVHCQMGGRARMAKKNVAALQQYDTILCCGLEEMNLLSNKISKIIKCTTNLTLKDSGIFLQFQDPTSSTYTYLIGDKKSKECILIDPVLERLEHDLARIAALGLTLVYGINTHCHADHVTSTGQMKLQVPSLRSVISAASGADADVTLKDGEELKWANGARTLKALATPGHTNGCMSFLEPDMGVVFTGDCLLIDGCGRTDFQEGSSETLYRSVHKVLFALPVSTMVYPGHDYKGRVRSTIGHEQKYNSRLTKPMDEYVELMNNLGLSYPKKIDVAVPANMKCGV